MRIRNLKNVSYSSDRGRPQPGKQDPMGDTTRWLQIPQTIVSIFVYVYGEGTLTSLMTMI